MKSRYDYMQPSAVQDPVSGDFYPDPLTLNYHSMTLQQAPIAVELTSSQIEFFWRTTETYMGKAELDDVILSLNGIAHKNFLVEDTIIFFPTRQDIETSFGGKQNG